MPPWSVERPHASQCALTLSQILAQPPRPLLSKLTSPPSFRPPTHPLSVIFAQPLAPFSGLSSILPPSGIQVDVPGVYAEYKNAVKALSERLGEDKWFLGSRSVSLSSAFAYDLIGSTASPQRWTPSCLHIYTPFFPPHIKSGSKSPALQTLSRGTAGFFIPFSRVS